MVQTMAQKSNQQALIIRPKRIRFAIFSLDPNTQVLILLYTYICVCVRGWDSNHRQVELKENLTKYRRDECM